MQRWILAIRPKTLLLALSPVLLGAALAYRDGAPHMLSIWACLGLALSIQIGTNLTNDYYDFLKGTDNEARLGPLRVMQHGLVSAAEMRRAIFLSFGLSMLFGALLALRAGSVMLTIAAFSVLSGLAYTAGPFPLAYIGLADAFVLIFFGPVAVAGTYYAQTLQLAPGVLMTGWAAGLLSTNVLVVNNVRDVDNDANFGKLTLPVRFGRSFGHAQYLISLAIAALVPVYLVLQHAWSPYCLLALLALIPAIGTARTVLTKRDGPSLNDALANTAKLQLLYCVLLSIGCVL